MSSAPSSDFDIQTALIVARNLSQEKLLELDRIQIDLGCVGHFDVRLD